MRRLILATLFLLVALPAMAQQAAATNHLQWSEAGPDLLTVQTYGWNLYPDAATTPTAFTGVTVSGSASPFGVIVAFPTFTPGTHTAAVTATDIAGESGKSNTISFQFVVIPLSPVSLRITAELFFKGLGGTLVKFIG